MISTQKSLSQRLLSGLTTIAVFITMVMSSIPAFAASADEYGKLNVDDFSIIMNEELMTDNKTVEDGDKVELAFKWSVDNNSMTTSYDDVSGQYAYKYRSAINTKGINVNNPSGILYDNGVAIGRYEFDGNLYVNIVLYDSAFKNRSDICGGIRLSGEISLDADDTLPNGTECLVGFGNAEYTVIYDDGRKNQDLTISKSNSELTLSEDDNFYVDYTITVTVTGFIDQFILDDEIDENLIIDSDSIKVDGQAISEKAFPITIKTTNKTKSDKQTIKVTYRAALTMENYEANRGISLTNKATATYNDGTPKPVVKSSTSTVKPKGPSINKGIMINGSLRDNIVINPYESLKWTHLMNYSAANYGSIKPIINYAIELDLGTGEDVSDEELKTILRSIKDDYTDWSNSGYTYMTENSWIPYSQQYAQILSGDTPSFFAELLYKNKGDLSKSSVDDSLWNPILHDGHTIVRNGNGKYTINYSIVLLDEFLLSIGNAYKGFSNRQSIQNTITAVIDDIPVTDDANLWLDIGINLIDKDIEFDTQDLTKGQTDWTTAAGISGMNYETGRLVDNKDLTDVEFSYGIGSDGILEIPHRIVLNGEDFAKWFNAADPSEEFTLTDKLQMMTTNTVNGNVTNNELQVARPFNDHHYLDVNDFWAGFHIYAVDDNGNMTEIISSSGSKSPQASISAFVSGGGLIEPDENGHYRGFKLTFRKEMWYHSLTYSKYVNGESKQIPRDLIITYYSKVKMVQDEDGNYILDPQILKEGGYNFLNTAYVNTTIGKYNAVYDAGFTLLYPNVKSPEKFYNINKSAVNSLTINEDTFEMTTDNKVGWGISIPLSGVSAGDKFIITDTLPENLTYDKTSLKALYTKSSVSKNITETNTELVNGFDTSISNNDVIFSITVTQDMLDKATELGKTCISLVFSTNYESDKVIRENSDQSSVTFENSAKVNYNGSDKSPRTANQSINIPKIASKEVTVDEDFVEKYNQIVATYTLNVNITNSDLNPTGNTLSVIDTMPKNFILQNLKVVDNEDNIIDASYEVDDNNVLRITVPNNKYVKVIYDVEVDVDVIEDPLWYISSKTNNVFEIEGVQLDATDTQVSLAKFSGIVKAWVYSTTGSLTISKYTIVNGEKESLAGAKFELYSMYDNTGNVYTEYEDEYLLKSFEVPAEGEIVINDLPLDRVYKLVETEAPSGYNVGDINEYYFILETTSEMRVSVKDPRDVLKAYEDGSIEKPFDYNALVELVDDMEKANAPYPLSTYNDNETIEISNFESIDIEVTKTWVDDGLEFLRPDTITIDLYRSVNDSEYNKYKSAVVEVPDDVNTHKYVFKDLPSKDRDGNPYKYEVRENVVGYTTAISGMNITNTIDTVSLDVTKVWVEDNMVEEFFNYRPDTINLRVFANNTELDPKSYSVDWTKENDKWYGHITNLPKYINGEVATYTVKEVLVDGYEPTYNTLEITNTYVDTEAITFTKVWNDFNNKYDTRPDSIVLTLTETNTDVSKDYTFSDVVIYSSSNSWDCAITNLPKHVKVDGKYVEANYVIKEKPVIGYNSSVDGKVVTNDLKTTSITVNKTWVNDKDYTNYRPESIFVDLYSDGKFIDTYEIKKSEDWSLTINDLPELNVKGDKVKYTIKEHEINNYTATINDLTVSNEFEFVSLYGTKVWSNDNDAKANVRPESIEIQLYGNNEPVNNYKVEWNYEFNDNEWNFEINNLPKYDVDGNIIIYTIKEIDSIYAYSITYDFDRKDGNFYVTITNSYETPITEFTGEKTWVNDEKYPEARPDSIDVVLYANGKLASEDEYFKDVITKKTVTAETNWSYTFDNLPELYKDGTVINYTVKEDSIPLGYKGESYGQSIINVFTMDKVNVIGTKTWLYDNEGIRPDITLKLYADGKELSNTPIWTKNGNVWTYQFRDLDKFEYYKENGKVNRREIVYTVEEIVPDMYKVSYDGFNITNTRIQKVDITKISADTGMPLEGATLQVISPENEVIDTWVSGTTPHTILDLIPGATYTLEEISVPDGYTQSAPVDFTVSETGEIVNAIMEDKLSITKFAKVDENGNFVTNALLAVYDKDGVEVNRWVTDEEEFVIKGLVVGETYTLKELATPDGYVLADDIEFVVEDPETYVEMTDIITKTNISKLTSDGLLLQNAELAVYDSDNNEVDRWITTDEPHQILGLVVGKTYTLKELSAPDGYVGAEDIEFTITEEKTDINMIDELTVIHISKIDNDGFVVGASLEIRDSKDNLIDSWVTDDNIHEITGLLVGETYKLIEVSAPNGYVIAEPIEFTIEGNLTEVTMTDVKTVTSISKVDEKGKLLAGASLQVIDKDGNIIDSWISDENIHTIIGLTVGETYKLVETAAPNGYAISESIEFIVQPNTEITMTDKLIPVIPNETPNTGDSRNLASLWLLGAVLTVVGIRLKKRED